MKWISNILKQYYSYNFFQHDIFTQVGVKIYQYQYQLNYLNSSKLGFLEPRLHS